MREIVEEIDSRTIDFRRMRGDSFECFLRRVRAHDNRPVLKTGGA